MKNFLFAATLLLGSAVVCAASPDSDSDLFQQVNNIDPTLVARIFGGIGDAIEANCLRAHPDHASEISAAWRAFPLAHAKVVISVNGKTTDVSGSMQGYTATLMAENDPNLSALPVCQHIDLIVETAALSKGLLSSLEPYTGPLDADQLNKEVAELQTRPAPEASKPARKKK